MPATWHHRTMSVVRLRPEEPPRAALAPPPRLARLARSDDPAERLSAALSHLAPAEALECLAIDADTRVRQAVAANPATPLRTLDMLAGDADVEVRAALAAAAPTAVLRAKLLHDTSAEVKAELLRWHGRRCEGRSLDAEAATATLVLRGDADPAVAAVAARMRSADAATRPAELAALGAHPDDEARRNAAAHRRCPTKTIGRLAGDPCWAVAFAALDNTRCPRSARDAAAGDVYACSLRAEHQRRAEDVPRPTAFSSDPNRSPVYEAEHRWRAAAQSKQPFRSAEDAAGFVRRMLADQLLQTRYSAVCEQLESSTTVRFDTKLQMFAGRSEGTEIRLHPKAARPEVLLHEMAHLIVRNDPRLALLRHPPESHGPEFVAVMLDLAETLYGSVERDRLKEIYRTEGAQMLAEQPLNSELHTGRATEMVPAAAPAAVGRPRGPPAAAQRPVVKLCGRIVKQTRRRCLLARGHRGRCRSTLPHPPGASGAHRRRSKRRR